MHSRSPFYALFTFTLAGAFFFVTGAIGWQLGNHNPIFMRGEWAEGPIWSQIGVGLACLVVAAIFYRLASRDPRLRSLR